MTTSTLTLLSIPPELRCRIYTYLFEDLQLTGPPLPIINNESDNHGNDQTDSETQSLNSDQPTEPDDDDDNNTQPSTPTGLSILQTCRQCHTEASNILWKTATFRVQTLAQHKLLQSPALTRLLHSIRHLAIDSTLLGAWPSSQLPRSLASFTVLNIVAGLRHLDLARIQGNRRAIHAASGSGYADIDIAPSLVLFRALIVALEDSRANQIMEHFNACHGSHTLRLDFTITCLHVGQVVVPGAYPMAGAPHRHDPCKVVYSFNT